MAAVLSLAAGALQLAALDSLLSRRPKRSIGDLLAMATFEEEHRDELVITDHPVEQGATIADHAFKRPAMCTLRCGWTDSGRFQGFSKQVYADLLAMQEKREPIALETGKRSYASMLLSSITEVTTEKTENSLLVTLVFREVTIVNTVTTTVSSNPAVLSSPQQFLPTVQTAPASLNSATLFVQPPVAP